MKSTIAGSYELLKYGYEYKNQNKFEPISAWYCGQIQYSDNGVMNVIVRFAEKPAEFKDIVAYSGNYHLEGDKIVHKVTHSVRPEYEGQTLERVYRLEGDILVTEFENTSEFVKYAHWKRHN